MLFSLPDILLDIPRNPIFAVGIPITLGTLSGLPTRKQVKGEWYKVCLQRYSSPRFLWH